MLLSGVFLMRWRRSEDVPMGHPLGRAAFFVEGG